MVNIAEPPQVAPAPDGKECANNTIDPADVQEENQKPICKKSKQTLEEELLEKQIESLSVPGYSIHEEGVFTIITRAENNGRSRTFPARLAR